MKVTKRNGTSEDVKFDKITQRLERLAVDLPNVNPVVIARNVCTHIVDGIHTRDLDTLSAQICTSLVVKEPEYDTLGRRILLTDHQKQTDDNYVDVAHELQKNRDRLGNLSPVLDKAFYAFILDNGAAVRSHFAHCAETYPLYPMSMFGWKTLYSTYLLRSNGKVVERPEHLFYRISLFLHLHDFGRVEETYRSLVSGHFIHATPTLFHAGTRHAQMSSCFLLGTQDDVSGIFKTISDVAKISKWAGGIGVHISNIRSKNSYIRGTNGVSNGIMPMLKVYNDTSRYIDQGGGKRKGSVAIYMEPWHGDILDFLHAKRNIGSEDERARDLFYGLWIPDIFMERVERGEMWSLMCPDTCPGLTDVYGPAFTDLYTTYEREKKYMTQIDARELWKEILNSQIETGLPYMLYKDTCNSKSNQKHCGTIRSSNLCTEIIQYSSHDEYSVCNLASINLSNCIIIPDTLKDKTITLYTKKSCAYCKLLKKRLSRTVVKKVICIDIENSPFTWDAFLSEHPTRTTVPQVVVHDSTMTYMGFWEFWNMYMKPTFDFHELRRRVAILVVNMNKVIDKNYYPVPEARVSNMKHRPLGIGVQGLANLFCRLNISFESQDARVLNQKIFETMYFAALESSCEYCQETGYPYKSFKGSPLSQGLFHFDMCPQFKDRHVLEQEPKYDWEGLRNTIRQHGVANSLLLAPMPTASTSQILGQNECFEPFTSNMYVRRTLAGEFTVYNPHLLQDLKDMEMWNQYTVDHLIVQKGSVQSMTDIPETLRQIYKTAWEIPQKALLDLAADRQHFIDQSQSLNIFVAEPSLDKLTKIHFYGWKAGLKTGSYYIRTKPQHFSQNFTVDPSTEKQCLSCSA
jgi:ribonucleoside-diphosphate reductase alpha subunit